MKKTRLFLYVICLLLCWHCSSDEEVTPVLEPVQQAFSVSNKAETIVLEINSNGAWTLTSKAVWCEIDAREGVGEAKVNVKVKMNMTDRARQGILVLQGQELEREIVVSQAALALNLDTTTISLSADGGEAEIKVYANTDWNADSRVDWLHVKPVTGIDSGSFRITVDANRTIKQRQGDVFVSSGMVTKQVHITQEGIPGVWHREGEVKLYREEDAGHPVKLVFMGDGFIEEDMLAGGAYDRAMEEAIDAFLTTEPYKTYRNYFCPYVVYAISGERGMSTRGGNDQIKVKKNTAFSVDMKEGTTLMNANLNKILEYAKKIPGLITTQTSIVVAANDTRYAGTCYHWGNGQTVSLIPMNRDLRPPGGFGHLVVHEGAGHGFGRLADEYTGNGRIPAGEADKLKASHQAGQFLNVTTSKEIPAVFWGDFIGREGYEVVGFYEGAYLYNQGVWRSEKENCMINNIFYFSIACRLSIVQRLKTIAGESFDVNDFITTDVQKAPTPGQLAGTRGLSPDFYPAPTPPILVDK